jgi:hypothetical protein
VGLLDDIMEDDANLVFSDTDGFAESLTYRKYPSGTTRTVYGIVDRMSPEAGPGGRNRVQRVRISLPNNTTRGITAAEWQQGDEILVADRLGETAKYRLLKWPSGDVSHDAGMCVWEI